MILYRLSSGTASTYCDFIWVSAKVMNIFLDPFKCQLLIMKSQIRILSIVPKTKWPYSFNFCKIKFNIRIRKSLGKFHTLFPEKVKFSNIKKHLFYLIRPRKLAPIWVAYVFSWPSYILQFASCRWDKYGTWSTSKKSKFQKIWHRSNFLNHMALIFSLKSFFWQ